MRSVCIVTAALLSCPLAVPAGLLISDYCCSSTMVTEVYSPKQQRSDAANWATSEVGNDISLSKGSRVSVAPRYILPKPTDPWSFAPSILREHRIRHSGSLKQPGTIYKSENERDMESMKANFSERCELPVVAPRDLFGNCGLSGGGRSRPLSNQTRVNKMRWRSVLQTYTIFDPLSCGYIDVDVALQRLNNIYREDSTLAEMLLQILEDFVPFISSRYLFFLFLYNEIVIEVLLYNLLIGRARRQSVVLAVRSLYAASYCFCGWLF